jgi:hypothetical protein
LTTGDISTGAITLLQIPHPTDPRCDQSNVIKKWLDVDDPDEMNETLVTADRKQFCEAGNTPRGDDPLSGLLSDPAVHQSILDGTFQIRSHTNDKMTIRYPLH